MSTHRVLARSAGTIGALTGVSRLLGFVRDLVIATAFGTGIGAEAFVVSFKIPNLLRDVVGEGATNSAFVPVLTECHEKKREEFWGLVSTLFIVMTAVLAALSILGIIFSSQIVSLIAPGFVHSSDPEKFPLAVRLTRVIFPYVFLIGLSAFAMGVLNSLKEFTTSSFGPILLNLSMIISGYFFERTYGPMALVVGVLAGGVLQLGCQIPALVKRGFRIHAPIFGHGSIKKIGRLLLPRALGSALYQINVFVDSILASFEGIVGAGGQSALYYSNRLFQLPLAIFGVALAQAILPTFSTQIVRGDMKNFKETFSLALRSLMLVVLPASVGLVVLSRPIVRIIFEHGRFNAYSTAITANALFFYAFGLLSCCFIKILVNAFYAMQDTRTPVKTMVFSVTLNIVLSLLFMSRLKIGGLALASSISATVNAAVLYYALRKKIGSLGGLHIASSFFKIFAASVLMGVAAFFYNQGMIGPHSSSPLHWQIIILAVGILLSIGFYVLVVWVSGIEEMRKLLRWRRA